jgi:hypothetical protein
MLALLRWKFVGDYHRKDALDVCPRTVRSGALLEKQKRGCWVALPLGSGGAWEEAG